PRCPRSRSRGTRGAAAPRRGSERCRAPRRRRRCRTCQPFSFFFGFQAGIETWRPRASVSCPAGVSLAILEPAPIYGPRATRAGLEWVAMTDRNDLGALAHRDVAQDAVRSDAHAVAEPHPTFEQTVHVDRHVAPALERTARIDVGRVGEGDDVVHQLVRLAAL